MKLVLDLNNIKHQIYHAECTGKGSQLYIKYGDILNTLFADYDEKDILSAEIVLEIKDGAKTKTEKEKEKYQI